MNRDSISAFVRASITVLAGLAILAAIGRLLGWWFVAGIAVYATADTIWCALQLRRPGGWWW